MVDIVVGFFIEFGEPKLVPSNYINPPQRELKERATDTYQMNG